MVLPPWSNEKDSTLTEEEEELTGSTKFYKMQTMLLRSQEKASSAHGSEFKVKKHPHTVVPKT